MVLSKMNEVILLIYIPHADPWFLAGVTAPLALQSTLAGGGPSKEFSPPPGDHTPSAPPPPVIEMTESA
jgi:hypothetical protein